MAKAFFIGLKLTMCDNLTCMEVKKACNPDFCADYCEILHDNR